ncbi:hypothetical protein BC827DRAFT_41556 [Russula dissimulans]|nr:hypothetical protein BC827DRAFT_41556 [Russula dissimulans]
MPTITTVRSLSRLTPPHIPNQTSLPMNIFSGKLKDLLSVGLSSTLPIPRAISCRGCQSDPKTTYTPPDILITSISHTPKDGLPPHLHPSQPLSYLRIRLEVAAERGIALPCRGPLISMTCTLIYEWEKCPAGMPLPSPPATKSMTGTNMNPSKAESSSQ